MTTNNDNNNSKEKIVHPTHQVDNNTHVGNKWCKLCGLDNERELSEPCSCNYENGNTEDSTPDWVFKFKKYFEKPIIRKPRQ